MHKFQKQDSQVLCRLKFISCCSVIERCQILVSSSKISFTTTLVFNRSLNFDVNILEKLKSHWSVQPEFQTAASYRKINISQTVEAMRLKFYEHAHKVISKKFGIHSTAQFRP
jgi:hypothetical protein